jgi:hypothetical protein
MSRATTFPDSSKGRKARPVATGVLDYFPDAIIAISEASLLGAMEHNGGVLGWNRAASTDEADAGIRHFMQRGTRDKDGVRHSARYAWRALALLQKEIEDEKTASLKSRGGSRRARGAKRKRAKRQAR